MTVEGVGVLGEFGDSPPTCILPPSGAVPTEALEAHGYDGSG